MHPRPLPVTAGRRGLLALFGVAVVLAVAALLVPSGRAGVPAGALLALTAQCALFSAQRRLLTAHLASGARTTWADITAGCLAGDAVLVVLLGDHLPLAGGSGWPAALLHVGGLGAGLVGLGTAVTALQCVRPASDRMVLWLAAAASVALLQHAAALPAAPAPLHHPSVAVALLLAWALVACGAVLSPPPERTDQQTSAWGKDLTGILASGAAGVAVLVFAGLGDAPRAAVWLAGCGTAVVLVKVVLLVRELISLQGAREAALTDELTGVPNRRALLAALEAALAGPDPVGLMLLDLDRFKHVNDGLGHLAGDELLRQVAVRLTAALVPGAVLARLGGDEFSVLLTGPAARAAEPVALGLHAALLEPFPVQGHLVHAPASIGVAVPAAGELADGHDLLRRADTAMYAAKSLRSGVVVHDGALDGRAREVLQVGEELRAAVAEHQLVLHFQPQLRVSDGVLCGVEALVRWQHPHRGLLAPDAFLGVAEEVGIIAALTGEVLSAAVHQASSWHAAGTPVRVSVNLTPADVRPGLVETVSELLADARLPPELLVLEITETSLVVDPDGVAAVLRDLVALGVQVSIDDFGTGYSSLTLLLRLPVAEVKVDRSFVAALLTDAGSRTVVRASIELAHSLGMRVVAEGVEDDAVLTGLRELGCDTSQGYFHSRPLPPDQLTAWMASQRAGEHARAAG